MRTHKTLLCTLIIIIILAFMLAFITLFYSKIYIIGDSNYQFEINIKQRLRVNSDITIKQSLMIDNKKVVLFALNEYVGEAEFIKGFNNKYKMSSIGYGDNSIRIESLETNNDKYIIIGGINFDQKISYAKLLLSNKEYTINIPRQEYFLTYLKIPYDTQSIIPDIFNIKYYNSSNIIIN